MSLPVIAATSFSSALSHPWVIAALAAAPVIYFGSLAIGRWLKRQYGVPLGLMYQILCVALAFYVPLRALHATFYPEGHVDDPSRAWQDKGIHHFQAALIVLGAIFVLQLLRRFYWQRWFARRHGSEAPKLLQEVTSFAAFCVAFTLVLKLIYGVQVDTFIAGSGIVAVVVGFAMQDTLSNIVAGITLQMGKPFRVGDWLIIDHQRAEVIEMNWRSTKLRTNDDVYLDIPNKSVASHTITNLSYPTKTHSNRIRVGFEHDAPPNTVREILQRAADDAPGVLHEPPPKVFLREFADSAIVYEIKYSIDDESCFNDIEDAIRTNVWYAARRAGLTLPFPTRTVEMRAPVTDDGKDVALLSKVIANQQVLAPLDENQRKHLLEHAELARFGRGETVIRQGSDGSSMFVIIHGEVEVIMHANDKDTTVAALHAGEAFGEMCLLTGEKRNATVRAKTDCDLWEIDRVSLQPLMQENTVLAEKLSELLARRRMENEGVLAAQTPPQVVEQKRKEYALGFRRRIAAFFEI